MAFQVACRDLGIDCDYVAKGNSVEELMADGMQHGKEVHHMTDAQLHDPAMGAMVQSKVKVV